MPADLKATLLVLIDAAGPSMVQVRKNIEKWFDSVMDRVSGWYKRRVQWISLSVALGLTLLLNADTFAVADALARDPVLRAKMVAAATERTKPAPEVALAPRPKESTKPPEVKDPGAAAPAEKPQPKAEPTELDRVVKDVNEVREYGWPLGWDSSDERAVPRAPWGDVELPPGASAEERKKEQAKIDRAPWAWLLKLLGLLVTAIAVSLGAPFWFDVLNRFIVIRSTVKPTEKSPNEPAVDGKK